MTDLDIIKTEVVTIAENRIVTMSDLSAVKHEDLLTVDYSIAEKVVVNGVLNVFSEGV